MSRRACDRIISDAEILALPIQPGEDLPPPGEYLPPAEKQRIGDFVSQWAGIADQWEITEETAPAAIAAEQRRVIAEARSRVGSDPKALADAVDLPTWTIERRLTELETQA